jgi:TRAP-type mannitol/chloroaromatic compound transport system permease large subunit
VIAVWALVAFVSVIIVWNAVLKRNIGEAMIVGFLAVGVFALFGGVSPAEIGEAVLDSMQEEFTFAGLAFVFMSYLLVKTPVLDKLIDLLNSVLGRLRGGPVYTATVAGGIFGAIAHVGAAVTAAVGSVTVPWMKRSGVRP